MTETKQVTINAEQELYVIPCGNGYTCLGFDVCIRKANAVALWMREHGQDIGDIDAAKRGTLAAYYHYSEIMLVAGDFCKRRQLRCPAELTPELIGLEGKRVEVTDKYGETRRFYVGKSTGWMPCHLKLPAAIHPAAGESRARLSRVSA